MAVGNRRFLEMAVDMTLSLKEHTALPVALCTDEALASVAQGEYAGVFQDVILVSRRFRNGRALKYGSAEASPFEESVFVDADCIVLGSLDGIFDVLEHEDLALLGKHLTVADDRNHHGFSTRSLIRRFGLDTYLKTNSGIFAFRRSAALAFMDECLDCYVRELRPRLLWQTVFGRWLGDEIAFGVVGGRHSVGVLPQPGPMYWPSEFAELSLSNPPKPLLHMIHPPPDHILDPLLRAISERRRKADLPGDGGTHWRWKIDKLRRSGRLGAVARRFGMRT